MTKKYKPEDVLEEIEKNRNHSWFAEIKARHNNKEDLDRVVIKYLGTDITYRQYFEESYRWAKALRAQGIKPGQEIVVCMDKTPEFTYLLGAASIIGATIKIISDKFDPEFIKDTIKRTDSKHFFVQNVKLAKLKGILQDLPDTKVVPIDYERSLNQNYEHLDTVKKYYLAGYNKEEELEAHKCITNIQNLDSFLKAGNSYTGEVEGKVSLDTPFTKTFSSGTTKQGQPKCIVHSILHYILSGCYHDPEVSGIPEMKGLSTCSNIPCHSNSWLSSAFSDILMKSGVVILDPVDDPEYFLTAIHNHESNFNIATTSTWLLTALNYFKNRKKYKQYNLKNAMFNFAAGEPLSPGEEKLLNKFLRCVRAKIPMMCTAGGRCEDGSIFLSLFRVFNNNKILKKFIRRYKLEPLRYADGNDPSGMGTYDFVKTAVLRTDGTRTHAGPYEYGEIVVKSPIEALGYEENGDIRSLKKVTDIFGETWYKTDVYGYYDESGKIYMKGRMPTTKNAVPDFLIADAILQDTKNIMSCEVVNYKEDNGKTIYVAYVRTQLGKNSPSRQDAILQGIAERCIRRLGNEIGYEVVKNLRVTFTDSYPMTGCAKRDLNTLQKDAPKADCHKVDEYIKPPKSSLKKKLVQ